MLRLCGTGNSINTLGAQYESPTGCDIFLHVANLRNISHLALFKIGAALLKVGDTIWRFDVNRRVYDKPGMGGRIIYREHFEPHKIGSETKKSWLVTDGYGIAKINKETMRQSAKNGWGGWQWFTAEQMEDDIWAKDHRYKLRDFIDRASPSELRAVAEAVGYNPETQ